LSILRALKGAVKAQAAIALGYFAGLRPGEIRGCCWQDYNPETQTLYVRQSVWHTHVTSPKTAASVKPVYVVAPLREVLAHLHEVEGRPAAGFILRGDTRDVPLNLDNLSRRIIRPRLETAGIPWHGYYALRRGVATEATDKLKDPLAAAGYLRHAHVDVTADHYIKTRDEATRRAGRELELLWSEPLMLTDGASE